MNDFLKGYSQGMTGSTNGLPSQSVLEAMGRDAARNQWNNPPRPVQGGGGQAIDPDDLIPVTTVLYEAGKKMRLKTLLRHFAIAIALVVVFTVLSRIMPRSLEWFLAVPIWGGTIWFFWTALRSSVFLVSRFFMLFEKK